jgi:preprotein translocase subunit SecA/nephrocystin-3
VKKSLAIRNSLFGENHADVAQSYESIGMIYGELGDHHKALEYEQKSLAIRLNLFGDYHADVAQSYINVGSSYNKLGDHQ